MAGIPGVMNNTQLVNYGIHEEKADLRFHVGVVTKRVFIFEPKYILRLIASGKYPSAFAYTGNIKTANGYLIPPGDIPNLREAQIPWDIYSEAMFNEKDSTSIKGFKAMRVVRKMISLGLISSIIDTVDVNDRELQIEGTDIIPIFAESYQVKCDWKAGPKSLGGSGNLYIQTAECNPLKRY